MNRWKLVGSVSAATIAVLVASVSATPLHAACNEVPSGTVTCTGNNAAGIDYNPTNITTLNVNTITPITPSSGVRGIDFGKGGGSAGNSMALTYQGGAIVTGGDDAEGIRVYSQSSDGSDHGRAATGNGTSGGTGSNGRTIVINSNGDVTTTGDGSHGISAYSFAGRGGNGGYGPEGSSSGGKGGTGGQITVTGSGKITTSGDGANGVLALSQGGRGGRGGSSEVFGSGGGGGRGGAGGTVNVSGNWDITINGQAAHAIAAYSFGGSGGRGGDGGFISGGGGSGGTTAVSGDVSVTSGGNIATHGYGSYGILAQSVAGHAGSGGDGGVFVNFSANGGSAGGGGVVTVINNGIITTTGEAAHAIVAQSIGGGGGSGGGGFGLFYSSGSKGSAGGDGGKVDVTNNGTLQTSGSNANGIFAQSIGGTGGDGGSTSGLVALGGGGATTSDGGIVIVMNSGNIATGLPGVTGTADPNSPPPCAVGCSHGIFSQSIGGGGGNGGSSGGWFSVGGDGGGGGDGASVTVTNSGNISTRLAESSAILAQSIGGGGGNGGGSGSIGPNASVAVGGSGGDGGDGARVKIDSNGAVSISTLGLRSHGIAGQSIGGGGGNGGFAVALSGGLGASLSVAVGGTGGDGGKGAAVDITSSGNTISTAGDGSHGIFAQSIGGGGGNGGFAVAVSGTDKGFAAAFAMGGQGGDGGNGGVVNVTSDADITTGSRIVTDADAEAAGKGSYGILAQSVGGGGGNGGFAVAGTVVLKGLSASLSFGGDGGVGGTGSDVTVDNSGNITTRGFESHAIVAQSVGGGGGAGGFSISGTVTGEGGGVGVALGGNGESGGDAGKVDLTNSGDIDTLRRFSFGVLAQSIGGGGGTGGFSGTLNAAIQGSKTFGLGVSLGGAGGDGSDGGRVEVENSGAITTRGDDSHGLVAQSIGGGGGNGGFAVAGSFSGPNDGPNGALNPKLAIGGDAGNGGKGSVVTVDNSGPIKTYGQSSIALLAQSIGGGGGNGGMSITGGIGVGLNNTEIGVSIGGKGGTGGTAGAVTVDSTGNISTAGDQSAGIVAQSIGGSGGNGGMSISGSLSPTTSNSLGVTIGGKGGSGNTASTVIVMTDGIISTTGDEANGILAQSIGGGGGNGGLVVSSAAAGGGQSRSIQVGVGGDGGTGANAGKVVVDNSAAITVTGRRSDAILAQSIGGGGGNGGLSVTATLGSTDAQNIGISIGGKGAVAGNADEVKVTNSGTIWTGDLNAGPVEPGEEEQFAHGIVAQSIGGGGGNGGMAVAASYGAGGQNGTANVNLAIGGQGGAGGTGAGVIVDNTGDITTLSAESYAILAQSIGGGGGFGAAGYAGSITSASESEGRIVNASIAIGGQGGSGNTAGDVTVANSGDINTFGIGSHGIVAESIGGGGGRGGSTRAITFNLKAGSPPADKDNPNQNRDKNNYSFSLAIGGDGGSGNHGGDVTVTNTGSIHTREADAVGIFAQSVGGGGGSGGSAAHGLPVPTPGVDKVKMYKNLKIVIGGTGGASGDGGDVLVDHSAGSIRTDGAGSAGIFAQSVGGGGGTGGAGTLGFLGNIGVGGGGGAAGDGGTVDVRVAGDITTYGTAAYGIIAQSVGGGGGVAGNVDFGLVDGAPLGIPISNVGIGLGIGQDGGSSGDGGLVTVETTGNITTFGDGSIGIFAQSVGGGGGLAGKIGNGIACLSGDCSALAGSAGGNGSGGAIEINHNGIITTSGVNAHGIFAQSAGGKQDALDPGFAYAPDVTFADRQDRGGDITIVVDGGVIVSGMGAHGIFAHTEGGDANGDISVELKAGGVVRGGTGSGVGVRFQAGATNLLTNHGAIGAMASISGMAVFGDSGDETIDNFGYMLGSVDLGTGANRFQNNADALFDMGAKVALGDENDLVNDGFLSPGAVNNLLTSQVTGNLLLNPTSTYLLDLDLQPNLTDRIDVSGATTAGGFTKVIINNPGYATPGSYEHVIINSDEGVTEDGLELITLPSAVITYGLQYPNPDDVVLTWDIDFAPADLNRNQTSIGDYVNRLQIAGGTDAFRPIAAYLFGLPDVQMLATAYDLMSPEPYLANEIGTLFSNLRFADGLLSCRVRDGAFKFNSEDQCGWFRLTGNNLSRDSSREYFQFSETSYGMSGGIQSAISDRVHVGFGASFETIETDAYANTSTRGERAQAGVTVKGNFGPFTLSNAFTGGYAWFDTDRHIGIPDASVKATAESSIGFLSNHVRAAYTMGSSSVYLRPLIDVGVSYLHFGGFSETGGGPLSLDVRGHDNVYGTISPAIELGGEWGREDGTLLRPFARLGLTHFIGDTTPEIYASFASGLDSVDPFRITTDLGETFVDTSVGLDFIVPGGTTLRLSASGQFSKEVESYGGSLKLSVPY